MREFLFLISLFPNSSWHHGNYSLRGRIDDNCCIFLHNETPARIYNYCEV